MRGLQGNLRASTIVLVTPYGCFVLLFLFMKAVMLMIAIADVAVLYVKATLELLDRPDAARFVKTQEQLQAEQQQAMQMQMLQIGIQDALAQRESDRTMQREIVRGLMS